MSNLSLKLKNGMALSINEKYFAKTKDELEEFITSEKELCTENFAKKVLFSNELKANNQVEGYSDDVKLIEDIIERKYQGCDEKT